MDTAVIEWMTEQLEQEGYEVIWAPNVKRLSIQNDISLLTIHQSGPCDIKALMKRDMVNQIAHKLAEVLVFHEMPIDNHASVRVSTSLRVLVP